MASVIQSPQTESGSLNSETSLDRYQRLSLVDRQSAETLQKFCSTNSRANTTATRLANLSNLQAVLTSLPLAMADFFSLYACLFLTSAIFERILSVQTTQIENHAALLISLIILPVANLAGLYPGLGLGSVVEFRQLARTLVATSLMFAGIGWFCFPDIRLFYVLVAVSVMIIGLPTCMTMRFIARQLVKNCSWWGTPTLILAEPERGLELFKRMQQEIEQGFRPVGFATGLRFVLVRRA